MQAAYIAISVIIVIASILLTLVVLVQNSKGGGLAANFAAGNQTVGVRQTADFLERITWGLAITILVLCVAATFVIPRSSARHSNVREQINQVNVPEGSPAFPDGTLQLGDEVPAGEPSEAPLQPED